MPRCTLSGLVEFHRTVSGAEEVTEASEVQNFQPFVLQTWKEHFYVIYGAILALFQGNTLYFVSEIVVECSYCKYV